MSSHILNTVLGLVMAAGWVRMTVICNSLHISPSLSPPKVDILGSFGPAQTPVKSYVSRHHLVLISTPMGLSGL
jgi:hypothetical protein